MKKIIGATVGTTMNPKKICDNHEGGKDGKSAYELALEGGFEGTKEEWLESLKGSDANVTTANITNALGYTPANQGDVDNLSDTIVDLLTETEDIILPEEYISEDTVDGTWSAMQGAFFFNLPKPLISGKEYVVIVNGIEYITTATSDTYETVEGEVANCVSLMESNTFAIYYYENGSGLFEEYNTELWYNGCSTNEGTEDAEWIPATVSISSAGHKVNNDCIDIDAIKTKLPTVEMLATFADGTTATYNLFGEVVQ